MKISSDCFNDYVLKNTIEENGTIGVCDITKKKNTKIFDTNSDSDLTDRFAEILDLYVTEDKLPNDYPNSEIRTLLDDINYRWNIFSKQISLENQKQILCEFIRDSEIKPDSVVGIPELALSVQRKRKFGILNGNNWNDFIRKIKTENRYFPIELNKYELESILPYLITNITSDEILYRARIANDESGYNCEKDISAPPPKFANEGRLNAKGISRLYLASDEQTAINEIRPSIFDYVTVGLFKSIKNIDVIDFSKIKYLSPFVFDQDTRISPLDFLFKKDFLVNLDTVMARPMRITDSKIDYVPTQYISDMIQSLGHYSGIKYSSTTKFDGYNLAIFKPNEFKLVDIRQRQITKVNFELK